MELGTVVPSSGGEYAYLSKAFGPIPGFLFAWTSISLLKPAETATICLAFATYAIDPFVDTKTVPGAVKLLGVATICKMFKNASIISISWLRMIIMANGKLICSFYYVHQYCKCEAGNTCANLLYCRETICDWTHSCKWYLQYGSR